MTKVQDKKMVPDIRFPGFDGEWEFPKAGSLFKNSVSKGYEGLPIYSVTQANGMVERSSLDREFDDISDPKGNRFVKKDDIAYNMMRMWQGAVGIAPVDCMISPAYVVLAPSSDVSSQFYYKMFKSKKYLYLLTSYSQGLTSDRLRLYYKEFAQMNLPHPSLSEQQKIASFLSDIDTKIEKLIHKKELLEQYKKRVMQKIFSREIRFKDENGEDFPEWEKKKLGEVVFIKMGQSPNSVNYTMDSTDTILVQGNADLNNGNVVPRLYTTEITKMSKKGDIIMTVRAPVGDLAISNFDCCIGRGVCSISGDKFIYYLLSFIKCNRIWDKYSQGSTFEAVNSNDIKGLAIEFPASKEQQKIADFLSDLDSKIIQTDKEIFAVKVFKKGLLQGMFV